MNVNKISGQKTRFSVRTSATRRRASTSTTSGSMSRADDITTIGWFQIRNDTPGKYVRTVPVQPQSVGRLELRRRHAGLPAPTSTRTGRSSTTGASARASTSTRRGFADRLTRGGPGGYVHEQHQSVGLPRHRQPEAGHDQLLRLVVQRHDRLVGLGRRARRSPGARAARWPSPAASASPATSATRSGSRTSRPTGRHALRLRPHRPDDGQHLARA